MIRWIGPIRWILFLEVRVRVLIVICLMMLAAPGYPETSEELVTKCREYDGKSITLEGEIVGEIARRGEFAWLNISDGSYGVGVFTPVFIIPANSLGGNYNTKGTILSVTGVFHRACSDHGGGLDIHATSIKLINHGQWLAHKIKPDRIRAVFSLALLAIIIISLYHLKTMQGGNKNEMD